MLAIQTALVYGVFDWDDKKVGEGQMYCILNQGNKRLVKVEYTSI